MIKAEHLTKTYRKKTAVNDLSFSVATGKVTGFLGPNGAGKSTTMRLMLGLERDSGKGRTTYDGQPLHEYVRPSQVVGILLEAKAFHPTRTARNHLKVLADAGGVKSKRVDEVLEIVGLQSVARKAPGKFSLGMSQRLGIAAAILGEPKYLLLDEPANGLDPEGIAWLRQFIGDYADQGNAVLVSSHLLSEMAQMADNIVVIGKGKLIANTTIDALIAHSSRSGIVVRTPAQFIPQLEAILKQVKLPHARIEGGFKVKAATTDTIGKLAYKANLPLMELASKGASLEDAFLELTGQSVEYSAPEPGSSKTPKGRHR